MQTGTINRMKFAGSWYTRDAAVLRTQLQKAMSASGASPSHLSGAVVPHAGLEFSAAGQADAFARVDRAEIDQVVLLAPSHSVRLTPDELTSAPFAEHETPLGPVPGETELPPGVRENADAVEQEHAVELVLPFVRYTLPERPLTAVLVPEISSQESIRKLRDTLLAWPGAAADRTLFLASSDFTHYGDRFGYTPYASGSLAEVERAVAEDDQALARSVAAGDERGVFERITDRPISVCGRYPMLLLAALMNHLNAHGEHTRYYTSNEIHPRSPSFVCYATVVFSHGAEG